MIIRIFASIIRREKRILTSKFQQAEKISIKYYYYFMYFCLNYLERKSNFLCVVSCSIICGLPGTAVFFVITPARLSGKERVFDKKLFFFYFPYNFYLKIFSTQVEFIDTYPKRTYVRHLSQALIKLESSR